MSRSACRQHDSESALQSVTSKTDKMPVLTSRNSSRDGRGFPHAASPNDQPWMRLPGRGRHASCSESYLGSSRRRADSSRGRLHSPFFSEGSTKSTRSGACFRPGGAASDDESNLSMHSGSNRSSSRRSSLVDLESNYSDARRRSGGIDTSEFVADPQNVECQQSQQASGSCATWNAKPGITAVDMIASETYAPFQRLLDEVPDPETDGVLLAFPRLKKLQSSSVTGSPLLLGLVNAHLINHILGCYEAVRSELSHSEAVLWDYFVSVDKSFKGTLQLSDEHAISLNDILETLLHSAADARACVVALQDRLDEHRECDFADVLDVFRSQMHASQTSRLRYGLQWSISMLLEGSGLSAPRCQNQQEQLRGRTEQFSTDALALGASAYQRSLVLTRSWQCERRLESVMGREDGKSEDLFDVSVLLRLLHRIHDELAPTERVLWELLCKYSQRFDGKFLAKDVANTLDHVQSLNAEGISSDLQEHRQRFRDHSLHNLVGRSLGTTTLAGVLWWWWDMTDECREVAGFVMPTSLLRGSVVQMPEEIFRTQLGQVTANLTLMQSAIRGQVRTYAELHALATRRSIEHFFVESAVSDSSSSASEAF
eukprot:TRINITY_DN10210_c0_g2_i1.p1 TRINITY_DN10210_c0_g2~~TRINITY_DN10210_c0_g2_i1.p1  ORF type:complete len:600 (-),score=104.48 TRINITY_DN10210_c0_g2_i1:94-1893(-)